MIKKPTGHPLLPEGYKLPYQYYLSGSNLEVLLKDKYPYMDSVHRDGDVLSYFQLRKFQLNTKKLEQIILKLHNIIFHLINTSCIIFISKVDVFSE